MENTNITDILNRILTDLESEINIAKGMERDCINNNYFEGMIANQSAIRGFESAIRIVKKHLPKEL